MGEGGGEGVAAEAAARLRALRGALLEALAELPETRLGRPLERPGWTLRHEIAALAALDVELPHVLDALRAARDGVREPMQLRRLRGEAMLAAQQLRLGPLRERLAAGVDPAVEALERAHELLEQPLAIAGRPVTSGREYVRAAIRQAEDALGEVRRAIAGGGPGWHGG